MSIDSILTVRVLIESEVLPSIARAVLPHLQAACSRFSLTTPARIAALLGQCVHESTGFTALDENLYYRRAERILAIFPSRVRTIGEAAGLVGNPRKLANVVYSNRFGNGDVASDDGWRYRARGAIGITFKDNYRDQAIALGQPYLQQPELLEQYEHACLTAASYFHQRKCHHLADAGLFNEITRAVNPGLAGRDHRLQITEQALRAMTPATIAEP